LRAGQNPLVCSTPFLLYNSFTRARLAAVRPEEQQGVTPLIKSLLNPAARLALTSGALAMSLAASSPAAERVGDFGLLDHQGYFHQLSYCSDRTMGQQKSAEAIVGLSPQTEGPNLRVL
jgi:hypothetical protein